MAESSFWNGDFYFDNIHSSTYQVCIVDFNLGEKIKEIGLKFGLNLERESSYDNNNVYNEKHNDANTITIQIAKTNGESWTTSDLLAINKWLFKKNFKKFQSMDFSTDSYNIILYLKAIDFTKYLTPDMQGYIEFTFQSFDNYSYVIPNNSFTLINNESKILTSYSNIYDNYKPIIKITNHGNESTVISIRNRTTNNTLSVSGMHNGEVVTIDCKIGSVLNSEGINRFEILDNYDFIELVNGNNEISLVGNAIVEFVCEFPIII